MKPSDPVRAPGPSLTGVIFKFLGTRILRTRPGRCPPRLWGEEPCRALPCCLDTLSVHGAEGSWSGPLLFQVPAHHWPGVGMSSPAWLPDLGQARGLSHLNWSQPWDLRCVEGESQRPCLGPG